MKRVLASTDIWGLHHSFEKELKKNASRKSVTIFEYDDLVFAIKFQDDGSSQTVAREIFLRNPYFLLWTGLCFSRCLGSFDIG